MARARKERNPDLYNVEAGKRMTALFDRAQAELGFSTQEELWRYLGIHKTTANVWKRGENPPRAVEGQRVAEKLGIDYVALLNIYNGRDAGVDTAQVIAALEWALTKIRSGEWGAIQQVRAGRVPPEVRAEVEKAHARSAKPRPTGPPAASTTGLRKES